MSKEYIGRFEEVVLLMVGVLEDNAYGAALADEISSKLEKNVNLSAVHVTLYRLEDKGYIKSTMSEATKKRGGRRKRVYSLTTAGVAALKNMKQIRVDLWNMVPQLKS